MAGVLVRFLVSLLLSLLSLTWTVGGGAIVGGEEAAPGEFPHLVAVLRGLGGSLLCAGSLIAPDKVLTAGHCCDG